MKESLEEIRDKWAKEKSGICYCAGPVCSGCEKNTREIFCDGFNAAVAEIAKRDSQREKLLVDALISLRKLIESGDLCRDISQDNNKTYFIQQGLRITIAIQKMQKALAEYRRLKENK